MSDGYSYTCDRATKQLTRVVRLLAAQGILQVAPDEGLIHQCVRRCTPCRRGKGPRRCCGWQTVVERGLLALGPVSYGGRPALRLDVSADCSYQRSQPARAEEWRKRPVGRSTVVVEIFEIESDELLERHHVDLANPRQLGTVWHLQYGGNPSGAVEDLPTSWLKEPRWPIGPIDVTLLLELLTYNFFPAQWDELNGEGEWLRLIWTAEDLLVSHYAHHIKAHFERAADLRQGTWLAEQDNARFSPRP